MDNKLIKKSNKKIKEISMETREWIFDLMVVVCLVIFSIIICPRELQNDTFYTIKCGEYVFQNGIFNLTTDEFSWLDLPYCYPHWLYDLMMYIIYLKTGFDGIYISTIVFTVILGLSIYNAGFAISENRIVSSVIAFLSLYLTSPFIAARAQLVTFILFTLELYSIEMFIKTKKVRYPVYLVLIAGLIAQLHVAVFPMFFVFFLPYIAEFIVSLLMDVDIIGNIVKFVLKKRMKFSKSEENQKKFSAKINKLEQDMKIRKTRMEKNRENPYKVKVAKTSLKFLLIFLLIMEICCFTGLLNPTGNTAYTYLLKTMEGNTTQSINEHLPVTLMDYKEFAVALIIFILVLTFMDLKIRLCDVFMLAGVTYLAFAHRRQISIFSIASAPILIRIIASFFEKYDSKTCEKLLKKATSIIGFIIIIGTFCYFGYDSYKKNCRVAYINEGDYPVAASDWIIQNLDLSTLKIYNEYNYGSYLIYKGIPVFIDSRADLYAPEFNDVEGFEQAGVDVFNEALDVPSNLTGYDDTLEKYGVSHVILYSNSNLCIQLDDDKNYDLIYEDDYFKIYERLKAVANGE